jgi:hypothetical protein
MATRKFEVVWKFIAPVIDMSDLPNIPSDRITEELQKLYQLFQSGALTANEYAQAKSKILEPTVQTASTTESLNIETQIQLLRVEMENALLRIDQDWGYKRESYLIYPRAGSPFEPSNGYVVLIAFCGIIFIIPGMMILLLGAYQSPTVLVSGIVSAIAGFALPIHAKMKLSAFREALDYYYRHRSNTRDRYEQRIKELQSRQYD